MTGSRFAIFLTLALSIWGLLHLYVFFRLSSVPWVENHVSQRNLIITGVMLWLSYVFARMVGAWCVEVVAYPLEFLASTWMGILFLVFAAFLVVDGVTLGGAVLTPWAPHLRAGALGIVLMLAVIAQIQGLRAPVVTHHVLNLPGLPARLDGSTMIAISDLHLGRLLGEHWLQGRIAQIDALKPDVIVAVGDVVDGNSSQLEPLIPVLGTLKAPLGVWAVSGNHEFYEGLEHSLGILDRAGWRVLRDESVAVTPGLVFSGVDDLTARPGGTKEEDPLGKALSERPEGATILLSHSPMLARRAAELGAQLMLSGHTHAGQIWPFNYLVRLRYRQVSGRYDVEGMPVIVGRGTGTWGPRMRLWQRSEILHLTLRSG